MNKVIEKNINMNFEEKIKKNIERSYWKFLRLVDKKSRNWRNKLRRRRRNVVEKSQSQSNKFDCAIDVGLCVRQFAF